MGVDRQLLARRSHFDQLHTKLWADRTTFDTEFRDLSDYFKPRRSRFLVTDRNKGDRRNQKIINSTPAFAVRTLQSGFLAGLTSPARPWLKLTTPDPRLAMGDAARLWLHQVTERMLSVFIKTNLYNALPTLYGDLAVFGTGAMGVLEDDEDLFRCQVYPVGSYAFSIDSRGLPATFVREYELTIEQLVAEFGFDSDAGRRNTPDWSRFSSFIKTEWDRGFRLSPVTVVHVVEPNDPADRNSTTPWPYVSVHIEKGRAGSGKTQPGPQDDRKILRDSGFNEFPIMLPRWEAVAEDVYGTDCPGITALGDAKALQTQERMSARAIQKGIDPPVQAPTSVRTQQTSLLPGGITYVDGTTAGKIEPIHEVQTRVDQLEAKIAQTEFRIRRAFFEDLFLMLATSDRPGTQPVTAREIQERHEEKLLALGPVLARVDDELLDPLVDRTFAMMNRAGLIPEPPAELVGVDLRVEYISLMAQAQKLVGVVSADRFLQSVLGMSQMSGEVIAKVKWMETVDEYARLIGVNPELVRSTEEATEIVEAQREAAEAAQRAEQMKTSGQAAESLSKASLETDNALRRLVAGAS